MVSFAPPDVPLHGTICPDSAQNKRFHCIFGDVMIINPQPIIKMDFDRPSGHRGRKDKTG